MNKNIFLLSSVLMATTATAVRANEVPTTLARVNSSYIQKEDTTETAGNDHGVMLNAKDATEPRQVEIGLPMSYTAVTVDGLPAVFYYWPNTTSNHWRGEQLLASQGLQNISTTAIRFGEIGYGVDSYMERGGETFKGKLKYQTNTFGAQNFDINVSGKLAKKTYFTLSAYQNFDPGTFDLKFTNYIDRAQFYTAGITHLFHQDKGRFSLYYKFTETHPLTTAANYPDLFDYVGLFSAGVNFKDVDMEAFPAYANLDTKLATQAKKGVKLYWIAIGKEDQHMNNNKLLMERLDKDGLKYTYHESSRGHIWSNWQQYTLQFVPQLFK